MIEPPVTAQVRRPLLAAGSIDAFIERQRLVVFEGEVSKALPNHDRGPVLAARISIMLPTVWPRRASVAISPAANLLLNCFSIAMIRLMCAIESHPSMSSADVE